MYKMVNMERHQDYKAFVPETFGEKLRYARASSGMTQQAAADALEVSLRGYIRWEKDEREPSFRTLRKIVEVFGVSVDWLLGIPPLPPPDDDC